MKKHDIKKFIIICLIAAIVCVSVIAILLGTGKTYSAYSNVIVPEGKEVCVYVSGNDVKKSDDGKNYIVAPGASVTVTVVNESKLFKSMTINGTVYENAVADITVPASGDVTITVETNEPYAEDVGKYFGNPFVLSKEADVLAVARILAGKGSSSDYSLIGADGKTAEEVSHGYFRLGTNLFISNSEFFGLGFRGGLPFSGCFDFDGYTATINLVRTGRIDSEFTFEGSTHFADYGFFAYAYGDGVNPCLIRDVKLQGFIGLNTMQNFGSIDHVDHVNAGGVAGTAGKNIVFDGIESTVSVSAQTRFADLYLGGIFGICSSSVEAWCDVRYDGAFNDVSGVTYGNKAGAIVGGFAGVLHNASVNGLTIDGERSMVLANALGEVSGSAIAGGFVGVIELGAHTIKEISDPRPMVIRNITIYAESDYSVSAVINNSGSASKNQIDPDDFFKGSAGAVAGGIVGIVNRGEQGGTSLSSDKNIVFSDIYFMRSSEKNESDDESSVGAGSDGRLFIKASTQDAGSSGAVFAGGTVGYIYGNGNENIVREITTTDVKYMFNCHVDVSAVQNGIGPAYAGGVFGYNCFGFKGTAGNTLKVGIVPEDYDYTVTAMQSASSSSVGNKYYNVCAGGYTSRLNIGYEVNNGVFYIGNGRITAYREVGSTAIGDVNAGGFAGRIMGYGSDATTIGNYDSSGRQSGSIDNLTIYFSGNSRVEASCYSFSSINGTGTLGNNVCAGGAVGYVLGYISIDDLSLVFDGSYKKSGRNAEYFVCGTQNASNSGGDNDLKTEGFVGGVFGLVIDTKISNVKLIGDETENSVVYFTSANSPNTASVGGLIGSLWRRKLAGGSTLLNGAVVKNVHAAGKAYCDKTNSDDTYDIYVGGALGVLANPNGGNSYITNISVQDSVVDAIGEKTMLTYAGGIVAGMWWSGTTILSYGIVRGSAVTASSIAPYAYAGGIAGLIQNSAVSYCLTQDTEVKAVSEQANAYAGGIAARSKSNDTITYSYSNASLNAQGVSATASLKYGIIARLGTSGNTGDASTGASKNFFVYETAGTASAYPNDSNTRALYLASNYQNKASLNSGRSMQVYTSISTSQSGTMTIKSHNSNVASVSGLNVTGVRAGIAYVSAYCKINNVEYLLCSYPVTVNGATENGSGIALKTDDGTDVSSAKYDEYLTYEQGSGTTSTTYLYFRRNIGNPDTIKKVNAVPVNADYLPQSIKFYDITGVSAATYFDENTTVAEKNARISEIIAAKGTSCDVSSFNGRANVGFNYAANSTDGDAKKSVYFYANDNVRENTIILMECDYGSATYGVIVEFVPNRLTGIVISPESGTPPLDTKTVDGVIHYIYTAGDVARFGATLTYTYPAPRSYVVETIYSGTGVTENGTVVVSADGVYTVTCEDLKRTVKTTVIVEAKVSVEFSFAYSGADGTFDRKMVNDCEFIFGLSPQPGYGLNPTITVTINGETAEAEFTADGLAVKFGTKTFLFKCTEDTIEENAYELVAPAEFTDYVSKNGKTVAFSISYRKIYSLVFIANYNGNDFFSTTVAAGEKFASVIPDGFKEWTKKIISARYGFDFRGFYTVSKASDMSAYGKSFEDMQNDPTAVVSGTMRFYARWTYNISFEMPENVKVTSSMSASMLHDGVMIPLDSSSGFGFVIGTGDGWQGKPRYNAYIRKSDGQYIDITSGFTSSNQENGYYVSSEALEIYGSGYIYVKIYADSLEFAVGDDAKYDGSALYTDGIFTVTYNVNYGSEDLLVDYYLDFLTYQLPAGTSIRLFYQKNGVSEWSGSYMLDTAKMKIGLSDFSSMKDGSKLTDKSRGSALSERFTIIVTLPNNTNLFGITSATEESISKIAYKFVPTTGTYGVFAPSVTDKPESANGRIEEKCVFYPSVIRKVNRNEKTFKFYEEGSADNNVTDHRHNGVYYMWKIEKVGGGYIGKDTFGSFGNEIVRTTDAIYYAASRGVEIVVTEDLGGYNVSLIEVKNVKQPSESLVLYTESF